MKEIFEFKSSGTFYDKEKNGIKNNTIREIDLSDDRFLRLIQHNMNGYNDGELIIKITNHFNESFEREIKDISIYKNWMIITWGDLE
jgi:hypothetical protein